MNDLARAARLEQADLTRVVDEVIRSGRYLLGEQTESFEAEFAAYLGVSHAVGVANGTDALQLALAAAGCTAGDEVVTVANAGGYTTAACRALGLVPRYVDVDPATLLVSTETALPWLDGARAIVVTHLYGAVTPDLLDLCQAARAAGLVVIEDCAQAAGAVHAARRAGSFGDLAAFSFYPTKNLGALGDGGAVVTGDAQLAESLRSLRQYGWDARYEVVRPNGRNSRLDEIQAAVLRHRLRTLDERTARRLAIYHRYRAAAGPDIRFLYDEASSYVAHLAVATCDDRAAFRARLHDRGIATDVHYPICDHRQPVTAGAAGPPLPVSEHAADVVVSVPLFPELTETEIEQVCAALAATSGPGTRAGAGMA